MSALPALGDTGGAAEQHSHRGGVGVAHRWLRLGAVLAFWIAYVLARPFGASIGDYLSQPCSDGGLGLGTVGTSALFLAVILGLVVYLTVSRRDVAPAERELH